MMEEQAVFPFDILDTEYFKESHVLNLLPAAVYVCDASGKIVSYNRKAVEFWGRTPKKGDSDERFCGAYKLYYPNGKYMPHSETPVAACLKDGVPRKNLEVIIERPDLSRIVARVNIAPVKNKEGDLIGMVNCFDDITQQKIAEDALSRKTRELEDYVENGPIGLHWVNENGIILWANKAELDMLGYDAGEYIGHHISEFHVEQNKIDDILNRLSCNETLRGYESTLRCKDGSTRTVHISSNVFWENGKFIHTRCFTLDVTEHKKLYEALKESEERYRSLIQTLDTPLYTTDKDGKITLYNKAAADLWGQAPVIGKDLWCGSYKILKPDGSNLPLDNCPMAVCLREHRAVIGEEIIVIRPDGTLRNVAPHPQPIFDNSGNLIGAINMLVDITEMKYAEKKIIESEQSYRALASSLEKKVDEKTKDLQNKNEELRLSEERYHKMVDEVEDYAIILLDKNGFILNWNKGAEKIKGYEEKDIIGKHFETFYLPEERANQVPQKIIHEATVNGKAAIEGWRLRQDGSKFWGSIVITALHNEKGDIIGFTKVTRDLTERKLAEDRLREYSTELEFRNKELEQFTYAASHDMKEPLRKINIYGAFIRDNKVNSLDSRSMEYLERALNAAGRMGKLIDDLLAYSRTTLTSESCTKVDLNTVIDEVLSEYKEDIIQKNLEFSVEKLPIIEGIAFQLKQLMLNLVGNAIKYSDKSKKGVIKISATIVKASQIEIPGLSADYPYHCISVEDNGIGFEQEYVGKIFEMFQRLESKEDTKGSGIGLAICKKIVQNHKGYITAVGKLNQGARFDVYLPTKDN